MHDTVIIDINGAEVQYGILPEPFAVNLCVSENVTHETFVVFSMLRFGDKTYAASYDVTNDTLMLFTQDNINRIKDQDFTSFSFVKDEEEEHLIQDLFSECWARESFDPSENITQYKELIAINQQPVGVLN